MKYLPILLSAGLLAAQPAFADSSDHTQRFVQHLEKTLNINEEQAGKVADIMKAQREKMHAVMDACHEQNKAKVDSIQQDTHSQLAGILNADQMKQLEAMRNEHMKRHDHRRAGPDDGQGAPGDSAD